MKITQHNHSLIDAISNDSFYRSIFNAKWYKRRFAWYIFLHREIAIVNVAYSFQTFLCLFKNIIEMIAPIQKLFSLFAPRFHLKVTF